MAAVLDILLHQSLNIRRQLLKCRIFVCQTVSVAVIFPDCIGSNCAVHTGVGVEMNLYITNLLCLYKYAAQ